MASERPNLLLICVDQWRGDSLGVAGHPVVETPHLDALAQTGALFTQAYSACPSCIAARSALFTGLSPRRHGFVGYRDGVHWQYPVTLAGTLASAGYHTQCVGKMHVYPERNLMGFHNVVLHDGYLHFARSQHRDHGLIDDYLPWLREKLGDPNVDYTDTGIGCNGYAVRPWIYDDRLHPTSWVTTQGIDFLRRRDPSRPFFLMLSYHRPHPPLDPPRCFLERYLRKDLPPLPVGDWVDHELPALRGLDSPVPRDPEQIDLARRAYYAQLSHIDQQINRMVVALHEYGLLHDTAILFTSDHGDMLYDHNYIAKSLPYDGSCRVPFILHLPGKGVWDGKPGQQIDAPVELRDIFPTLCDLAGVPIPEGLDGASVLPLLRGEERGWREYLHGEHAAGQQSNHWMTDGREKYAWFSQTGCEQLFEIATDPQERHDLAPLRQDRVAFWRRKLARELDGRPEGFVQEGKIVVGRPVSSTLAHAGVGV
ncbi:MAG TPA: arylsulfatase [Armatimonadetes bacterium]|jgi:arylsulfatase|nr:arylsulfatase [Armatimonadota bacterium]